MNGNGRKYLWAAVLSAALNCILFGYISFDFLQTQGERERKPLETDVRELKDRADCHDAELKTVEVALEGIRQQLRDVQEDVKEIKEAVR